MTPPRTRISKRPCPELKRQAERFQQGCHRQAPDQTKKDIAEHGLPFPLLADPTHDTAKNYGVLSQINLPNGTSMTIASRDTFLIDPERQGGQALRRDAGQARRSLARKC